MTIGCIGTQVRRDRPPAGIQDLRGFSMSSMAHLCLTMMMWLLLLPIFEARLLPKPTGGLKLQITQRGLDYARSMAMEGLLSELTKKPIPDQHTTYNIPPMGKVSVSFSNVQIQNVQLDVSAAEFYELVGARVTIRNIWLQFSSDWNIRRLVGIPRQRRQLTNCLRPRYRVENGTVQASIGVTSLSVLLGLDVDDGGRPLVRAVSCSSNIQDLALNFSGPNSHHYNRIFQGLKRFLISSLNQEVCTEIKESVDHFSHNLRDAKFWEKIDSVVGIDYSLVGKPEITGDRCNLDFKGEFFSMRGRQRSPLEPTPIRLPDRSLSMAVMGISDFSLNSAAMAYFTEDRLRLKVTDKMIPKRVPFRLNTKHIGAFLPELKTQFPEMPMEVHLAAREAPKLHFHPGGLNAAILGRAQAFVLLPNSSLVPVFTLGIECNLTGEIFLEAGRLHSSFAKLGGSVALKGLRLSQESSRIGAVPVSQLEGLLKIAGHVALLRENRKLRAGILLPSFYGASLMGPEVSLHEGFMLIQTDLQFSLPHSVL